MSNAMNVETHSPKEPDSSQGSSFWRTGGPTRIEWIAYSLFTVVSTVLFVWGCTRQEVPLVYPLTAACYAWSTLMSISMFFATVYFISGLSLNRFVGIAAALPWAILFNVEFFLLYYSRQRFDSGLFRDANREYIWPFVTAGNLIILLALGGTCLTAAGLIHGVTRSRAFSMAARFGLVAIILWRIGPNLEHRFYRFLHSRQNHTESRLCERHEHHLSNLRTDVVFHFSRECYRAMLAAKSGPIEIRSLDNYQPILEEYDIPLNKHHYTKLPTRPYRRIIMIVCESLSGSFLTSHNPQLPEPLMPEIERLSTRYLSVPNLRGIESSTMQALDAMLCSHPNAELIDRQHHPQSMISALKKSGYRTDFMGTWPRLYCNMEDWSQELGFDGFHGLEEIRSDPNFQDQIRGEFLPDRKLFARLVNLLKTNRTTPQFVLALTCDSHIPTGRMDYGDVSYPSAPDWTKSKKLSSLLRSFFHLDQDLHWFIQTLENEQLFDEDTLVIITADHCCPPQGGLEQIPGYDLNPHGSLPLLLISSRPLPPLSRQQGSQLDISPSLLHLLNIRVPEGSWGKSLFDPKSTVSTFATMDHRVARLQKPGDAEQMVTEARTSSEKMIHNLMRALFVSE